MTGYIVSSSPTDTSYTCIPYSSYYRLKASEVDRRRCKTRLVTLKERLLALEAELAEARKECDRLTRQGEKAEAARASLLRKDTLLKVSHWHE
jgi:hypothetical protein